MDLSTRLALLSLLERDPLTPGALERALRDLEVPFDPAALPAQLARLHLEERLLIMETSDAGRRYALSPHGRADLVALRDQWRRMTAALNALLEG